MGHSSKAFRRGLITIGLLALLLMYGSNASMSSDVQLALQYHVDNKTLMTFPINNAIAGSGSNLSYHISWLGDFLLRSCGNQQGKGWYLDLVYIGYSTAQQCG